MRAYASKKGLNICRDVFKFFICFYFSLVLNSCRCDEVGSGLPCINLHGASSYATEIRTSRISRCDNAYTQGKGYLTSTIFYQANPSPFYVFCGLITFRRSTQFLYEENHFYIFAQIYVFLLLIYSDDTTYFMLSK